MLTAQQCKNFDVSGVLKVKSLLSVDAVARARAAILGRFASLGLAANGRWTLSERAPAEWPDKGYSAKSIGNKISDVERLLDEPGVQPIVDTVLDHADLDREFFKRPQVLVTLPNAGAWFAPTDGWHVDIARTPSGVRPGVQVFILLSEIKPQGGGTLVLAGSHRLLNEGRFVRSRDVAKLLRQDRDVCAAMATTPETLEEYAKRAVKHDAGQNPHLGIVELIGSPGDAYFMDMRVLHSAAPNMADQPRVMATHRFMRADIVPELAAG